MRMRLSSNLHAFYFSHSYRGQTLGRDALFGEYARVCARAVRVVPRFAWRNAVIRGKKREALFAQLASGCAGTRQYHVEDKACE